MSKKVTGEIRAQAPPQPLPQQTQPPSDPAVDVVTRKKAAVVIRLPEPAQEAPARADPGRTASDLAKTIREAARNGDRNGHALARIALGDLAHGDGDLTSACEHWQIARQLYADLNAKDELKRVEERMRRNGCPTDWVLNNF